MNVQKWEYLCAGKKRYEAEIDNNVWLFFFVVGEIYQRNGNIKQNKTLFSTVCMLDCFIFNF